VMLKQGFPSVLYCDNGGEFTGAVTQELLSLLGIQNQRTFSYRPQSNGGVERCHRFLAHMFSTVLPRHSDWVKYLDYIAFTYNSTPNKTTGHSPHLLHWGREAPSPIQALLSTAETQEYSTYGDLARDTIDRLRLVHAEAQKCSLRAAASARKFYDTTVREQKFQIGDSVLVYAPQVSRRQYPKWKRTFCIKAVVHGKVNEVCYVVRMLPSGKLKCVHPDKMKLVEAAAPKAASPE
jgi:hypothetical protein